MPISIKEVAEGFTSEQKFFILRRLNYDGLVSLDELPAGVTFMLEKIYALSETEAVEILKEYLAEHDEDVNIPEADYEFAQKLVDQAPNSLDNAESGDVKTNLKSHFDTNKPLNEKELELTNVVDISSTESITHSPFELFDWSMQVRLEAGLIAFHSPYPEVRAVTEPYDDPSVPCETPRAIIVGLIWVSIGNGLALMFIKALGYNIDGQAQTYISDQKMGHYAKIPPRAMFRWQMVSVSLLRSFL
ncbi:hypothetical protein QCA50_015754 [Cerrena zonata]|uniref:Uncharacterized protein n=1 Tax=Cerrena zonata TaxID=2478898 RepID=A0AAW0FQ14_9APHY